MAVLAYDKRGIGQSAGFYPGASPTADAIDVLARDAAAAARFLARQPGIDPRRVGIAGQSQAGWIVPLAATREHAIRFLVLFSGPAVTADENDLFQNLTGEGLHAAAKTGRADRRRGAQGRSQRLRPAAAVAQAAHPVALAVRRPRPAHPAAALGRAPPREPGREGITIAVFPKANHALVVTQTGLTAEMLRSDTFAPGLFSRVGAWLRAHVRSGA